MKTLFLVLASISLLAGCTKQKPEAGAPVATAPLTLDETKTYLDVYDAAKAGFDTAKPYNDAANDNLQAYNAVSAQLNEAHKFPVGTSMQIVKRNCRLASNAATICDRTVVKVDPPAQQTVPPVTLAPKTNSKETPKK